MTVYYSLLRHITGYNIVLQSKIVYLCTLQCITRYYSMFQ